MADKLILTPDRATDRDGVPVSGAKATFFLSGTTTPQTVYADDDRTIPHPTPLVADASGVFPAVFSAVLLGCVVTDPDGNLLPGYPIDPVLKAGAGAAASQVTFTPSESLAATNVQAAVDMLNSRIGISEFAPPEPPRVGATTYTNSTDKDRYVFVGLRYTTADVVASFLVDGAVVQTFAFGNGLSLMVVGFQAVVPAGSTYRIEVSSGGATIEYWRESI